MATLDELINSTKERLAKAERSKITVLHVYKYVITDDSGKVIRTYRMDLKDTMSIIEGDGESDCTFTLTEKMIIEVMAGKKTMEEAIAEGKAKFEGNQEAFTALQEASKKASNK